MSFPITYMLHADIDRKKWDACVNSATYSLVYPCSWWLDGMADHWDALVMGNYDYVMPLTYRKKYLVKYLYQPAFTQQLGIFSGKPISPELTGAFLQEAGRQFRYAEIFLNAGNPFPGTGEKDNFLLNLEPSFESLRSLFKEGLRKNLKRAAKFGLSYLVSDDYSEAIQAYRKQYRQKQGHVSGQDYERFSQLCRFARDRNSLLIRKVVLSGKGLLAISLLIQDQHRLYNLMSTTLPNGRRLQANHFLYEQLVREFAGKQGILDFEGSDIPGISKFYRNFGAIREPYFFWRHNDLPTLLKYFKK